MINSEKSFQSENITPEIEIKALNERIKNLESRLEKEQSLISPEIEKKEIKKEIKTYLKELQKMPSTAAPVSTRDETKEIEKFPASQQVGALISLVFEKGLNQAISVAKGIDNPAILDEFHDILVDRYYEELIKKGIIKP